MEGNLGLGSAQDGAASSPHSAENSSFFAASGYSEDRCETCRQHGSDGSRDVDSFHGHGMRHEHQADTSHDHGGKQEHHAGGSGREHEHCADDSHGHGRKHEHQSNSSHGHGRKHENQRDSSHGHDKKHEHHGDSSHDHDRKHEHHGDSSHGHGRKHEHHGDSSHGHGRKHEHHGDSSHGHGRKHEHHGDSLHGHGRKHEHHGDSSHGHGRKHEDHADSHGRQHEHHAYASHGHVKKHEHHGNCPHGHGRKHGHHGDSSHDHGRKHEHHGDSSRGHGRKHEHHADYHGRKHKYHADASHGHGRKHEHHGDSSYGHGKKHEHHGESSHGHCRKHEHHGDSSHGHGRKHEHHGESSHGHGRKHEHHADCHGRKHDHHGDSSHGHGRHDRYSKDHRGHQDHARHPGKLEPHRLGHLTDHHRCHSADTRGHWPDDHCRTCSSDHAGHDSLCGQRQKRDVPWAYLRREELRRHSDDLAADRHHTRLARRCHHHDHHVSEGLRRFRGSVQALSNRLRKKRDGTPEKSATPSQEPDENLAPSRNVIWNEEIEKLQIKADELPKLWPPQPPSTEKKLGTAKQVAVQKTKKESDTNKPKSRMVSVAKPAPPDAPVKQMEFSGFAGPKYDEEGEVITHSLLGTYEDFHREATRRGDIMANLPSPREEHGRADTPTLKYEKTRRQQKAKLSRDDNNALANWQHRMMERKRQQGYISKLLQKAPEDLAMNQADNFRKVQEQRYLVDRAIPGVDYGKGYRVGSEFWHQQEQFGDDVTGLHMTLTQSQRGYPAPVEHVGLPAVVKQEKGCEWLGKNNPHVNYPWHKSPFLEQRKKQLQPYMEEMAPWRPDFEGLQIIGSSRPFQGDTAAEDASKVHGQVDTGMDGDDPEYDAYLDGLSGERRAEPFHGEEEEGETERKSVLAQTEGEKAPVFGPSLLFGGQAARWTGDSFSYKDEVGIEARVTFEAFTGDRVTSFLELVNDGTTSIYYDWKKMSKENPFDLVQKEIQRFYFNNASGVILPGETLRFPFVFKSPNAGVFSEQWNLETRPVVCGGAALLVTLRGVALQEDKFKDQREKLEKELVQRQAQQVVGQILHEVVSGIRTPDRARSPVDAYVTEEEIFRRNNPGLEYSHEHVARLAEIYGQLFEEEFRAENVWSLSVADLQESILQLSDEEDEKRENLLHQMNALVGHLSYLPPAPLQQRLQAAGYQLMLEAIDRMVGEALLLRHSMNLPDREQDDIDGDTRDSRKGARAADAKSKGDAGKDKGKGAAKDAKAAKGGGGKADGKGKASASATAQKKTPTPASKTTAPTPAPSTARVPTPGDKDGGGHESGTSHPGSPDPNVTTGSNGTSLNDSDLALAEKLYRESFTVQAYNILGEMTDKMDTIFSALKEEADQGQGS